VDKTIIIGGGFSALMAKLLLGDRPLQVISAISKPKSDRTSASDQRSVRRPALEINKLLSPAKALSLGTLQNKLPKGLLHDRLAHGGNSQIWGGFCNAAHLSRELIELLASHHISLEPLCFTKTGSMSNLAGLSQLTQENGSILNAAHILDSSITDAYVAKCCAPNPEYIEITLGNQASPIISKQVILAVGTVQLIDLLYRSGIICDGDKLSLTEFEHNLRLITTLSPDQLPEDNCIIRYSLIRAIYHALGVQRIPSWLNRLKLPFYVDQTFYSQSQELHVEISQGALHESPSSKARGHEFGGSIHYCNLRVNGQDINSLLHRFHPHLVVLGMPAVKQVRPGPISNDIINDAALKISTL